MLPRCSAATVAAAELGGASDGVRCDTTACCSVACGTASSSTAALAPGSPGSIDGDDPTVLLAALGPDEDALRCDAVAGGVLDFVWEGAQSVSAVLLDATGSGSIELGEASMAAPLGGASDGLRCDSCALGRSTEPFSTAALLATG